MYMRPRMSVKIKQTVENVLEISSFNNVKVLQRYASNKKITWNIRILLVIGIKPLFKLPKSNLFLCNKLILNSDFIPKNKKSLITSQRVDCLKLGKIL